MSLINGLSHLPPPDAVRNSMRSSAMLDVVLCEEEWLRCYEYQPKWTDSVSMAKYDDGSGNEMFAFFRDVDAVVKGFDHESPVSPYNRSPCSVWPGIYDGVPSFLDELLDDPAVQRDDVTFCVWHTSGRWQCGSMTFPNDEEDGSSRLLATILLTPDAYCDWAREYYERDLDPAIVAEVYAGTSVDVDLIAALNPDRDLEAALAELSELADA